MIHQEEMQVRSSLDSIGRLLLTVPVPRRARSSDAILVDKIRHATIRLKQDCTCVVSKPIYVTFLIFPRLGFESAFRCSLYFFWEDEKETQKTTTLFSLRKKKGFESNKQPLYFSYIMHFRRTAILSALCAASVQAFT